MLNPRQRQFLKAQAHHLKPAVHIGKGGVTDSLAAELEVMLESLELLKIKLNQNTSEELESVISGLKKRVAGLEHVWTIGKTILVFRPSLNKPSNYSLPQ